MRMRVSSLAVLLPALVLGACATTPVRVGLPAGAQDKIASTDVVVPIRQSEIYVYVPPSTGGARAGAQYGLIGAIVGAVIDASVNDVRTTKAETSVKPLRNAIVDYNFDADLQSDLKRSLGSVAWVHGDDYRVVRDVTPNGLDGVLDASKDSAVLLIMADYRLSNDGGTLDITMPVRLYPNNDALKALLTGKPDPKQKTAMENAIYRNVLHFEIHAPNATDDRDQNIAWWSANNGAAMRAALSNGAKELAAMLVADLQDGDRPAAQAAEATTKGTVNGIEGIDQHGLVVTEDSTGRLVRLDDGELTYVSYASSYASASPPAPAEPAAAAAAAAPAAAAPATPGAPSASANSAQPAS